MAHKRITKEKRILIYCWRKEHKGVNEIGQLLRRSLCSISHELSRNAGKKGLSP